MAQTPASGTMAAAKKKAAKKAAKKKAAVKKSDNVFAFLGTDEAQVKEAALRRVQAMTPADAGEFGQEIVDGTADSADNASQICMQLIQAVQTLPFFGGEKVVWLKSANFLGDNVTGRADSTQRALQDLADVLVAGVPSDVKLVISATEIDKRRTFYKTLSKLANVEVFDLPDTSRAGWEGGVATFVAKRAKARGLTFPPDTLEFFVMLAGANTRTIDNELEKLDIYLGDRREVTTDDVRQMVALSRAGVVFELGDAIGKRQLPRALDLLDHLVGQGENAIGILLAAVVPKVRALLLAKDLQVRCRVSGGSYGQYSGALGRLPEGDTAHLPRTKEGKISAFPVFLASQEAGAFSSEELRDALCSCLEANSRLVTSQLDAKLVLEKLLIGMLAR